LLFLKPQPTLAERALGLPVLVQGAGWSSFARGRPEPGQLILLWQGKTVRHCLHRLEPVDLGSLWECDSWSYAEGQALLAPQVQPRYSPPDQDKVSSILPAVPVPAPQREQLLERLRTPRKAPSNPLLGFFDLLKSVFGNPDNQRYMARMVDLFEKQQWQEALRYAIPIDNSWPGGELERFVGVLSPRDQLRFTPRTSGGTHLDTGLHGLGLLRDLYQKALEKLVQAGRIEEAAFLQGELLDDTTGAVELLETNGRLEAAARLATLKGLPAAHQVRLWFQAGQVDRALFLARRYFVHAEAIASLRARNAQLAERFRVAWAQDLAAVGRAAEALQVGWEVRHQLDSYPDWLRQGLDDGGAAAVQALGLGLPDPDLREQLNLVDRLEEWFQDASPATYDRRRRVLEHLTAHPFRSTEPRLQAWAERTARQLMRQANSPFPLGTHHTLTCLVNLSGDPWLRADRPSSLPVSSLHLGLWRETVEQQGETPIWEAALLDDGRLLVALGHAGLAAISWGGGWSQRFAIPAHHLVAPQHGGRFLAVSGQRISCYQSGRIQAWCCANFDGFARQHDGYYWLVWLGQRLFQIDLTCLPDWQAVHQVVLPEAIRDLALGPRRVAILTHGEVWIGDYPALHHVTDRKLSPGSLLHLLSPHGLESFQRVGDRFHYSGKPLAIEGIRPEVSYQEGHVMVLSHRADGLSLLVFPQDRPATQLVVHLPLAQRLSSRIQGHVLIVCDDRGRLLVADLKAREWLRQHFL
jgi:hypothetical protein